MNDTAVELTDYKFPAALVDACEPYEKRRDPLLEAARNFLDGQLQRIRQLCEEGASGAAVVGELTATFDQLNDILYQAVSSDLDPDDVAGCALLALGGYGREEMNPKSDLDLMFFYEPRGKKAAEIISDRMLYLLWDLSLDVGYSVRSAKDCLEQAGNDVTVRTAMLDARFLCGNPDVYGSFEIHVGAPLLNNDSNGFIKNKLLENQERRRKYGSSVYLLANRSGSPRLWRKSWF